MSQHLSLNPGDTHPGPLDGCARCAHYAAVTPGVRLPAGHRLDGDRIVVTPAPVSIEGSGYVVQPVRTDMTLALLRALLGKPRTAAQVGEALGIKEAKARAILDDQRLARVPLVERWWRAQEGSARSAYHWNLTDAGRAKL